MNVLALFLVLFAQTPPAGPPADPPASVRATLQRLRSQADEHKPTYGATPELTGAKHELRDWLESRLSGEGEGVDAAAFAETLHVALGRANLLCVDFDECDSNLMGFVDDVRVSRDGQFLMVVTALGIRCGYDESAYVYAWDGQWRRVWEHEQNTYTDPGYLPQAIHDVQLSAPDASQSRLLLALGSQTTCAGAFKDIYARAWQMDAAHRAEPVLNFTAHANDAYPPVQGLVLPDGVFVQFTAGGLLSGEVHTAVRRFKIERGAAVQIDPIAGLPRDFVVEWLSAPWEESRTRAESASLEAQFAELHRTDGVGDFPKPTLRCTSGADLWQVTTHMYEGPTRYYRVRWREPYTFSVVSISETPYPDCTVSDSRGETYPNFLHGDLR